MDCKVALVVLMGVLAMTQAAPRTFVFHRDYFNTPLAPVSTFSRNSGIGAPSGLALRTSDNSGNPVGGFGQSSGGLGGFAQSSGGLGGFAQSPRGNNFFNPSLYHLYNDEFEFDNEDFGLFRDGGGFFDFDPEDSFFPFF